MLFLDELPEYRPRPGGAAPAAGRPHRNHQRASGTLSFPANFVLIAAMNPCPCGYYGDPVKECTCTNSTISRYQKRISGPLLDRIDIHVEVPRVEYEKLADNRLGETSSAIRARVEAARKRQRERFKDVEGVTCNAEMRPAEMREYLRA